MAPRCTGEKFPSRFPRGGNKDSGQGGKTHGCAPRAMMPSRHGPIGYIAAELGHERDPTFSSGVVLTPTEAREVGHTTRFSCDLHPLSDGQCVNLKRGHQPKQEMLCFCLSMVTLQVYQDENHSYCLQAMAVLHTCKSQKGDKFEEEGDKDQILPSNVDSLSVNNSETLSTTTIRSAKANIPTLRWPLHRAP
jgi:hypothetical protein